MRGLRATRLTLAQSPNAKWAPYNGRPFCYLPSDTRHQRINALARLQRDTACIPGHQHQRPRGAR